MRRMFALPLALALPLAACGSEPSWQVVAVHTDPGEPGALLDDAAGLVNFTISPTELTGDTSCAPISVAITTDDDGGEGGSEGDSDGGDGSTFTVDSVDVGNADGCEGGARHVHEQLTSILVPGAQFETEEFGDAELLWTSTADELYPPSIRLMRL